MNIEEFALLVAADLQADRDFLMGLARCLKTHGHYGTDAGFAVEFCVLNARDMHQNANAILRSL
jgi:hypothetical protein